MQHLPTTSARGRAGSVLLALVALAAAALVALPASAGAVDAESPSSVTIESTPADVQGPCLPALFALSGATINTDDSFVLRITLAAPLCSPIDAAAAIYEMPGDGVAWPQTLRERVDFRLDAAGVTDVIFTKGCDAVQFDVVTGATPGTIAPEGPHHGPLLFPFDTSTSYQHWGPECAEVSPTTTESTTTTTVDETTSTTPDDTTSTTVDEEVLGGSEEAGATTTPPAGPSAGGETQPEVLGATQTAPEQLAFTGPTSDVAPLIGGLLLLGGVALLVVRTRLT